MPLQRLMHVVGKLGHRKCEGVERGVAMPSQVDPHHRKPARKTLGERRKERPAQPDRMQKRNPGAAPVNHSMKPHGQLERAGLSTKRSRIEA